MLGKRKSTSNTVMWGLFYIPGITRDNGIFVTDEKGYIFSEFFKALAVEKSLELPPLVLKHPDEAANEYVRNHSMVAVLRDTEGTVVCYSVDYRNNLPPAFTSRLRTYMQTVPDSTILWGDNILKEPQTASAREVIYGQKPEKPPQSSATSKTGKSWVHPEALNPDEMDYLTGKTKEPPAEPNKA